MNCEACRARELAISHANAEIERLRTVVQTLERELVAHALRDPVVGPRELARETGNIAPPSEAPSGPETSGIEVPRPLDVAESSQSRQHADSEARWCDVYTELGRGSCPFPPTWEVKGPQSWTCPRCHRTWHTAGPYDAGMGCKGVNWYPEEEPL